MTSQVLFTRDEIQEKVTQIASQIEDYYQDRYQDLVIIVVYNGAMFFAADLLKQVKLNCEIIGVQASSYNGGLESTLKVDILSKMPSVTNKHILIIDDIYDTGITLNSLSKSLRDDGALTVEICVLLNKKIQKTVNLDILFWGFEVPNKFVFGYGLDINNRFRNLDYIAQHEF